YLKTSTGAPLPLYVGSEVSGDDWRDKVRVVPNPLKGSAPWSATKIAQEIEFQNLPSSARVDIFTLSGDHIITLYHNNPASGSLKWNLLTKNGFLVSPGVYIAKISDSKGNSKILRFMILR
ncbi:MAG: T9SS type A sorting domain-containing protein, partial [candidate division WOR-3 bacterium]